MNLQNIVIDFTNDTVFSMFEDKHYKVDVLTEALAIEAEFKVAYDIDFSKVVVQLSEDQHYSEPRLICQLETEQSFVTIADVATNKPDLFLKLKSIRTLVEQSITEQLTEQN